MIVTTLGHQFVGGLSGQTQVVNFGNQINVTLQWQESTQSFVIVDKTANLRFGPPSGYTPLSSLPFCETPDALRAAIAADIDRFARSGGALQTAVNLCAVSVDNQQYRSLQGNAKSFPTDPGYVYYDVTLLNRVAAYEIFADDFILSHEWGHQVQFDNFDRAAQTGKLFELQADCLAGIYFGYLLYTNPYFMVDNVVGVTLTVCRAGLVENLGWTNTANHGRCEERAYAFETGLFGAYGAYKNNQSYDAFLLCAP